MVASAGTATGPQVRWHQVGVVATRRGECTARVRSGPHGWDIELLAPDGQPLARVVWEPPSGDAAMSEYALSRTLARRLPLAAEAWAGGDMDTARDSARNAFNGLGGTVRQAEPDAVSAHLPPPGAAIPAAGERPAETSAMACVPQKIADCMGCGAPETRLHGGLPLGVCGVCWHEMTVKERRALRIDAERGYRQAIEESRRRT